VNYETTEEPSSSLVFSLPSFFDLLLSLTFPLREEERRKEEGKFASLLSYHNNAQAELTVVVSMDTLCGCVCKIDWDLGVKC
jgi:hypothetical protein